MRLYDVNHHTAAHTHGAQRRHYVDLLGQTRCQTRILIFLRIRFYSKFFAFKECILTFEMPLDTENSCSA